MREGSKVISYEQLQYVMTTLEKSTDNYLFFVDFYNDYYNISATILERFNLPAAQFHDGLNVLSKIIHKEDFEKLREDFFKIQQGKKDIHCMEYRWIDKNNEDVWISCRGAIINTGDSNQRWLIGRISELGAKRKADNLTGFLMESQFQHDFDKAKFERTGEHAYIMKIGINRFKEIKEMHGLEKGDRVIKHLAHCIREVVGESGNVYRVGSKSFLIFFTDSNQVEEAESVYRTLKKSIHQHIEENQYNLFYSISVGVVPIELRGDYSYELLQKQGEFALNTAMSQDDRGFYIFNEENYKAHIRRIDIQNKLRAGVNNGFEGFEVYYQPLTQSNEEKTLLGAEALLRFRCEEYGMISPGEFIPILEESGLIIPVGRWVINTAIKQCRIWQDKIGAFFMSINLSYIQIKRSNVREDIFNALRQYDVAPENIVLELTESGQLESNSLVLETLSRFRKSHIRIAIDDFGTGYSNLVYLKDFDVNILKIDHTFTKKALSDPFSFRLVTHIIHMAHSIGLEVCLEGIETEEQKQKIEELSVDYLQGYLFGKPVSQSEFQMLHM